MDEEKKTPPAETGKDIPGSVDNIPAANSTNLPQASADQRHKKNRVLIYLTLLFAFAFLLLLLSYVINQRNNSDAMTDLTESHRTFTESAVNSIAVLQDENTALRGDRDALTAEVEALTERVTALEAQRKTAETERDALQDAQTEQLERAAETTALYEARLQACALIAEAEAAMDDGDVETARARLAELEALTLTADGGAQLSADTVGAACYADYEAVAAWLAGQQS